MDYRSAILMQGIARDAKLIEIGPSYNPLAPKGSGWKTTVVDHATREGLVQKYRAIPSVNTSLIEEVDHIWQGGSLVDLIPEREHGTFDAFIACHVIEHTTDVVRFLQSARTLLKPEGSVLLIVPDKRKCFDFFRPVSTTGDALVAYREKRQRHTAKAHFEHGMYIAHRNGHPAWFGTETAPAELVASIEAGPFYMALGDRDDYVDCHAWQFVPASFELMVLELRALGMLDLTVSRVQEGAHTEFFAWLTPASAAMDPKTVDVKRLELLNRMVIETAEQSLQILGSPLQVLTSNAMRNKQQD